MAQIIIQSDTIVIDVSDLEPMRQEVVLQAVLMQVLQEGRQSAPPMMRPTSIKDLFGYEGEEVDGDG